MRIKDVQAWWVRIPIETAKQHRSDFGRLTTFDSAILRIETDDGLVGWGEGKNAAGSAGEYAALVHLLNDEVGPKLIGRHAGDITVVFSGLVAAASVNIFEHCKVDACPSHKTAIDLSQQIVWSDSR